MRIEETDTFLIFREVSPEELLYFKYLEDELWFLEGEAQDWSGKATFVGSGMDLSNYMVNDDKEDDLKVKFTLYYFKKKGDAE